MGAEMPVVVAEGPGTREMKPGVCYYCDAPVGQSHKPECVVVCKRVRVKFTVTLDMDEPHSSDASQIEWRYNHGSWCADNLLRYVERALEAAGAGCLCGYVAAEVVRVVDDTPVASEGNSTGIVPVER